MQFKKLHGIFYFITYYMIVNWQARMASSAVWWLWSVTPAQQSDKTSISVSGKAARSTMALLITQIVDSALFSSSAIRVIKMIVLSLLYISLNRALAKLCVWLKHSAHRPIPISKSP